MGGESESDCDFDDESFRDVGCDDTDHEDEVQKWRVTDGKTKTEENGSKDDREDG